MTQDTQTLLPVSVPTVPTAFSTPLAKRSWPFLLGVCGLGLGLGFTLNILDPYLYSEKIRLLAPPGLKNTLLSLITIAALLVAFLVQPLIGQWSDRTRSPLGRRLPFLALGVAGISLALLLVVTAQSIWLLLGAALLMALFSNTIQAPWQALIPDRVPENQHGAAAGLKTLLEALGAAGGVALAGFTLSQGMLWTAPLSGMGLYWLLLGLTGLTLWPALESHQAALPAQWLNPLTALAQPLKRLPPGFLGWMLNRFLFWAAAIGIRTFLLNYLSDGLGMSPAQAQAMASRVSLLLGAGVLLLVLPAGLLADRIGRPQLLALAGLLAGTGAALLVFGRDLSWLFVAGGLIAVGAGIFSSASWSWATNLAPSGQGALYLGLANAATVLGSAAGRLGGPLIDAVNYLSGSTTGGYGLVFGLAALFFIGSSLVVLKIRDK